MDFEPPQRTRRFQSVDPLIHFARYCPSCISEKKRVDWDLGISHWPEGLDAVVIRVTENTYFP